MERLTEKHYLGTDHYMKCSGSCNVDMDCIDCPSFDCLVERLAAYEDTGLTPQEVSALIKDWSDRCTIVGECGGIDRMRELAEADKDGRLVVLPCKAGDGLWTFCNHPSEQVYSFTVTDISTLNGRTMLNTSRCGVIDARDVGKTVFRTREEAKKALEAMKDE
jgi:hypothetical protein